MNSFYSENVKISILNNNNCHGNENWVQHVKKYDVSAVPNDFGENLLLNEINNAVERIDIQQTNQQYLDNLYSEFCSVVKNEMDCKLPCKDVVLICGYSNKRRKVRKPWWNMTLQKMWNDMCTVEKAWRTCKSHARSFKTNFC